jgi:chromate transporter
MVLGVEENGGKPATSFADALKFWTKLGFISFGGPAGQIAIMHQEIVETRRWIGESQFLRALNFCMLLPGPEAQQLATYIGWRLHGVAGGIAAGGMFVIPSVFIMLLLSYLAVAHIDLPAVAAAFYGIRPVVVAVVIGALLRIGKKALYHRALYFFALAAFTMLFFFKVPFPVVVAAAALGGVLMQARLPQVFCRGAFMAETGECRDEAETDSGAQRPSLAHAVKVFAVCLLLWGIVVGALWSWRGFGDVLMQEALFFTKAAFVTFGGAYAVLGYIADFAVASGWLAPEQMLVGLGLAESTPGPLIMVTQYVGFLGAWNLPGPTSPLANGVLGALITTYVTFLPCFFFIFAGAPYIEAMAGNRRLQSALTGVTAAVVGVVLNLALWFGSRVILPGGANLDAFALISTIVSLVLLLRLHLPIHLLVPIGAASGILWRLVI